VKTSDAKDRMLANKWLETFHNAIKLLPNKLPDAVESRRLSEVIFSRPQPLMLEPLGFLNNIEYYRAYEQL
jgi:hypothetical protein